jgi:hypothetical protein
MKIMAALLNRTQASPRRERIVTPSFARERAAAWVWVLARYIPKVRAIILTEISHPLRDTRRKWRLFHERVTQAPRLNPPFHLWAGRWSTSRAYKKQLSAQYINAT